MKERILKTKGARKVGYSFENKIDITLHNTQKLSPN
jgi:hypothetical protein